MPVNQSLLQHILRDEWGCKGTVVGDVDTDLPPFESYSMTNRTYRYFTGKPLYAFGHGVSYTTFDHKKLALSSASVEPLLKTSLNILH